MTLVIKHQRQLATSTTHLDLELLMNVQCSGGSRSFAKETRDLKTRSILTAHQKLTMSNSEDRWSCSSYNYTRSSRRTQADHSTVIWHLKQISKVKKIVSVCLMSWPQIKKIVILKCHFLLFFTTINCFSIGLDVWWKVGFIRQPG